MNQNLTELFQKKQKQPASGGIDWNDRRDKYIAAVNNLYDQIEVILAEPMAQKTVKVDRRPKQLSENYIGTYSINDLILLISDEQVRFSPRGRNVVGASGRVDVLGERDEAVLVVQPDSRWAFVQTRQPTLKLVPFDDSSLAEMLKRVMRE